MNLKHLTRRNLLKTAAAGTAATLPPSGEASAPALTAEQQVDLCIEQLKAALAKLHPGCDAPHGGYSVSKHGAGTVLVTANLPRLPWTGPGLYELLCDEGRYRGVFHVERVWSDMDRCWGYYAASIWDGHPVAPRKYFSEQRLHILRKVEA